MDGGYVYADMTMYIYDLVKPTLMYNHIIDILRRRIIK